VATERWRANFWFSNPPIYEVGTKPQCTKIDIKAGANTRGENETKVYQNRY
jgi:hypothetical protein